MSGIKTFDELKKGLLDDLAKANITKTLPKDFNYRVKDLIELLIFSFYRIEPFYAAIFMQIERYIDFTQPTDFGIQYKNFSFHLYINPLILLGRTEVEMRALLEHEVYHISHAHLKRYASISNNIPHLVKNAGFDVAINQYIPNLPEGMMTLEFIREYYDYPFEAKEESEYYINKIHELDMKAKEEMCEGEDEDDQFQLKFGGNEDFDPALWETKLESEFQEESGNEEDIVEYQFGDNGGETESGEFDTRESDKTGSIKERVVFHDIHNSWDESDDTCEFEDVPDATYSLFENAASYNRGEMPEKFRELMTKLRKPPEVSWQNILKKELGSFPVPFKRTFLRRNRRQPFRVDLRGKLPKKVVKVAIIIDTSASVSKRSLDYFFNEIFHILKFYTFQDIHIIHCDSVVAGHDIIKKKSDLKDFSFKGRGGTLFQPAFDYLEEQGLKDVLAIYFTDGEGEYSLNKKPAHYKTLWVLNGKNRSLSLAEPYGEVKNLNMKK